MPLKIIRTEEQYHEYLNEIGSLIAPNASLTNDETERLELLTVLIESYESRKYPLEPLDPIGAILFRMEEKGLKRSDLIPYFGTSGRVSEILNRKRPLTVQMIKALALGLGISADTLIGINQPCNEEGQIEVKWNKFPIKEMMKRGWLEKITSKVSSSEEVIKNFILDSGIPASGASFRRTLSGEAKSPTVEYAIYAWIARIIQCSRNNRKNKKEYNSGCIDETFLKEIAQLSWIPHGPLLAVERLEEHGISVVFEPQLKGMQLDGAALKDSDGTPIIAMTLRYDRIDNFWFTLLHEIAHIWKHIDSDNTFVDDLNVSSKDEREAEANRLAGEAFIPRVLWRRSEAYLNPSKKSIMELAKSLKIHPAIIAGRIRNETGDFTKFSDMLGQNEIRYHFIQSLMDA